MKIIFALLVSFSLTFANQKEAVCKNRVVIYDSFIAKAPNNSMLINDLKEAKKYFLDKDAYAEAMQVNMMTAKIVKSEYNINDKKLILDLYDELFLANACFIYNCGER